MAFLKGLDYIPGTETEEPTEAPKRSRFNFPSISDILNIKTDNSILNWRGMFGGEPRNKVDLDPEALERSRRHHEFMGTMTGYGLQAAPIIGQALGGMGITEALVKRPGRGKPSEMMFKNYTPESAQGLVSSIVSTDPTSGFGKILKGSAETSGVERITKEHGKNHATRIASGMYNTGQFNLNQTKDSVLSNFNKDQSGKSIFDKTFDIEIESRTKQIFDPKSKPYNDPHESVSKTKTSNAKVGAAYVDLDTSGGCLANCSE